MDQDRAMIWKMAHADNDLSLPQEKFADKLEPDGSLR
jgi:hypothetical protein